MKNFNLNRSILLAVAGFAALCLTACSNVGTEGDSNQAAGTEMTEIERIAATYEPVEDGRLIVSESNPNVAYVYVDSSWREATEIEKRIGYACVRATRGSVVTGITGINNGTGNEYVCALLDSTKLYWKEAWIRDYPKEMFFNPDVEYGSVIDNRDGRAYKTVEIDGKTWMAENLAYVVAGIKCDDLLTLGCDYTFEEALSIADGDTVLEDKRGLCMEGWHIPDTTEWRALVNAHAVTDLLSERGWIVGWNGTGFSAVPTDYETGAGIIKAYPRVGMADFATSSTGFSNSSCTYLCSKAHLFGYSVALANSNFEIAGFSERRYSNGYDYARAAIRCVKDSE